MPLFGHLIADLREYLRRPGPATPAAFGVTFMDMRTTYRLETGGDHTRLTVWVRGANAGMLTVRNDEIEILNAIVATLEANGATRVEGRDYREKGL